MAQHPVPGPFLHPSEFIAGFIPLPGPFYAFTNDNSIGPPPGPPQLIPPPPPISRPLNTSEMSSYFQSRGHEQTSPQSYPSFPENDDDADEKKTAFSAPQRQIPVSEVDNHNLNSEQQMPRFESRPQFMPLSSPPMPPRTPLSRPREFQLPEESLINPELQHQQPKVRHNLVRQSYFQSRSQIPQVLHGAPPLHPFTHHPTHVPQNNIPHDNRNVSPKDIPWSEEDDPPAEVREGDELSKAEDYSDENIVQSRSLRSMAEGHVDLSRPSKREHKNLEPFSHHVPRNPFKSSRHKQWRDLKDNDKQVVTKPPYHLGFRSIAYAKNNSPPPIGNLKKPFRSQNGDEKRHILNKKKHKVDISKDKDTVLTGKIKLSTEADQSYKPPKPILSNDDLKDIDLPNQQPLLRRKKNEPWGRNQLNQPVNSNQNIMARIRRSKPHPIKPESILSKVILTIIIQYLSHEKLTFECEGHSLCEEIMPWPGAFVLDPNLVSISVPIGQKKQNNDADDGKKIKSKSEDVEEDKSKNTFVKKRPSIIHFGNTHIENIGMNILPFDLSTTGYELYPRSINNGYLYGPGWLVSYDDKMIEVYRLAEIATPQFDEKEMKLKMTAVEPTFRCKTPAMINAQVLKHMQIFARMPSTVRDKTTNVVDDKVVLPEALIMIPGDKLDSGHVIELVLETGKATFNDLHKNIHGTENEVQSLKGKTKKAKRRVGDFYNRNPWNEMHQNDQQLICVGLTDNGNTLVYLKHSDSTDQNTPSNLTVYLRTYRFNSIKKAEAVGGRNEDWSFNLPGMNMSFMNKDCLQQPPSVGPNGMRYLFIQTHVNETEDPKQALLEKKERTEARAFFLEKFRKQVYGAKGNKNDKMREREEDLISFLAPPPPSWNIYQSVFSQNYQNSNPVKSDFVSLLRHFDNLWGAEDEESNEQEREATENNQGPQRSRDSWSSGDEDEERLSTTRFPPRRRSPTMNKLYNHLNGIRRFSILDLHRGRLIPIPRFLTSNSQNHSLDKVLFLNDQDFIFATNIMPFTFDSPDTSKYQNDLFFIRNRSLDAFTELIKLTIIKGDLDSRGWQPVDFETKGNEFYFDSSDYTALNFNDRFFDSKKDLTRQALEAYYAKLIGARMNINFMPFETTLRKVLLNDPVETTLRKVLFNDPDFKTMAMKWVLRMQQNIADMERFDHVRVLSERLILRASSIAMCLANDSNGDGDKDGKVTISEPNIYVAMLKPSRIINVPECCFVSGILKVNMETSMSEKELDTYLNPPITEVQVEDEYIGTYEPPPVNHPFYIFNPIAPIF